LYGQFFLDDFNFTEFKSNHNFWGEKYAVQAGLKYINVFGIDNLDAQIETNIIRPFVYSHGDSLGNYTNYNQPLAHPMGANLKEVAFKIYFQPHKNISFNITGALANQGLDSTHTYNSVVSDWGSNPLMSYTLRSAEANNIFKLGGGLKTNIYTVDAVLSCRVAHNIYFDLNFIYRKFDNVFLIKDEKFFGIGFRMNATRPKFLF
jgi:hypothetical protein